MTTQQVRAARGETEATCLAAEGRELQDNAADSHQGLLESIMYAFNYTVYTQYARDPCGLLAELKQRGSVGV